MKPAQSRRTMVYSHVVSLSHPIGAGIPLWPGDPPLELETVAHWSQDGFFLQRFGLGEHSGTHLNAPRHFFPQGAAVDRLDPASLVVGAVVLDCRKAAAEDPDYTLQPTDVERWEAKHGPIPEGSLVVLWTGWHERWHHPVAFFNKGNDGRMHFPGFAPSTVDFLIQQRQVAGFGTDTHGIDPGLDETFAANRLALARGKLVLENLTNLHRLPPTGATLVIGVLPLQGGSGSPASVLAFIP